MKKQGSVYWHVGNSGVTFEVVDEGHGPTLVVRSGAFGNLKSTFEARTDEYSMRLLGLMLLNAASRRYSEIYCHPAHVELPRKRGAEQAQEAWDGKSPFKEPPPKPSKRPLSETCSFLMTLPSPDEPELSTVDAAFAILTAHAVFSRVDYISGDDDLYQWFPNLSCRHLGWLWQHGFFTEPQVGVLGWNPNVSLFSFAQPKQQSWDEAIHAAADLTKRMPIVGGPTPRDMGGPAYPPQPMPPLPAPQPITRGRRMPGTRTNDQKKSDSRQR